MVPGSRNLARLIKEFSSRPGGVIALFSEALKKGIASSLDEDADVELLEFGSLARRLSQLCGEFPPPIAHRSHVIAAIATACEQLDTESPFARTARFDGLHRFLADTLHELAAWNFEPDQLDEIALLASPRLAAKLRGLAQIEREVVEILRESGRALGRENMRLCLDGKVEVGAQLPPILLVAGDEISPAAIRLVEWALRQGARITVVYYRHPGNHELFRSVHAQLAEFGTASETGDANPLLKCLFTDQQTTSCEPQCEIVSTADPLAEVEWALRGCAAYHRQRAVSYDRIAIFARNLPDYAPLIESAAKRLEVPIQLARRAPLLTNSFASLARETLTGLTSRDVRALLPLLRSSYSKVERELLAESKVALDEARREGDSQWTRFEVWVEGKPDLGWLAKILDWRKKALSTTLNLEQWVGELKGLLAILPWDSEGVTAERDVRAQYVLSQSLGAVAAARRSRAGGALSFGEFVRRSVAIWEKSDVSVPAAKHGVQVVSQSDQLVDVQALWTVGMLEGSFPRRRSEDPILTDAERVELSQLAGGFPLQTSMDKAARERDEFYLVCAAASDRLTFSYPETDEDRDNVPAFYLEEIKRIAGIKNVHTIARNMIVPPAEECVAASDVKLRASLDASLIDSTPTQFESGEATTRRLLQNEVTFKPHELREALQCPFRHFARRVLDVRPNRLETRWHALTHLPSKANLISAEDETTAFALLENALEVELDKLFNEIPDWEAKIIRSGGERQIREWIEREFLARQAWPKENVQTGRFFGQHGLRAQMLPDLEVDGRVAATSSMGPYSIVHLLEAAPPLLDQTSPTRLSEPDTLYYGIHLMAAFEKGRASAVEVETMSGQRYLLVLPRYPSFGLASKVQAGLHVVDLGGEGNDPTANFYREVKRLLRISVARIRSVDVTPIRGEHCAVCSYGELCRRSAEFGEGESPFEQD